MRFFLFIIITLNFACIKGNKIPKDVIPQNQMRKIMWDLMRADAYVTDFVMKDSTRNQKEESTKLYERIFDIHATTLETFKKSLVFYQSRPDLFKAISDSLRVDEQRSQQYPAEKKSQIIDTTLRKMRFNKKLIEKKP
ncbi:MAG: DUF4296 domain-containing protein [Bacteroidetes bacterium]|jgi:hypothetical protein|nr:MAG: DUF4296 domain-containing protein [Bacteroidota bacterium]